MQLGMQKLQQIDAGFRSSHPANADFKKLGEGAMPSSVACINPEGQRASFDRKAVLGGDSRTVRLLVLGLRSADTRAGDSKQEYGATFVYVDKIGQDEVMKRQAEAALSQLMHGTNMLSQTPGYNAQALIGNGVGVAYGVFQMHSPKELFTRVKSPYEGGKGVLGAYTKFVLTPPTGVHLKQIDNAHLAREALIYIFRAMVTAVAEVHKRGLVFGTFDLRDFAVHTRSGQLVLTDLSRLLRQGGNLDISKTDPLLVNPERAEAFQQGTVSLPVNQRTDSWALGVLLYQFVAGAGHPHVRVPKGKIPDHKTFFRDLLRRCRDPEPWFRTPFIHDTFDLKVVRKSLLRIIALLIEADPEKRWTAIQLVNHHPFFKSKN